jgi:hypothetical protein
MSHGRCAAARVIGVAILLVVGGCAHREPVVPPTDPRRAYPDGHEKAEEEARSQRSLASVDRHRPPDCSDPAHPCSEVGSAGDLLIGEADDPAIGRRRDYLAEYHARRGSLSSETVEAALKDNRERFKACGLAGTALVRVVVNLDGGVDSAKMGRATLSEGTVDCFLDAVKSVRFPKPEAAAELLVPLVFRSR